jgi:hypothetical protein
MQRSAIGSHVGRKLIRLSPVVAAAIVFIIIGPDRLQHLQAWERWGLLGMLLVAFTASIAVGTMWRTRTTQVDAAIGVKYARVLWWVLLILNVCAFFAGIVAIVVLRHVAPLRYLIIAPIVNLLLAGMFSWYLFLNRSRDLGSRS